MTPEQKQLIKEKMSKILVKWSMPTRQVAINEIVQEFDLVIKQTEERMVEKIEEMIQEELSAKPSGETEETAEWYKVSALKNIITLIRNK